MASRLKMDSAEYQRVHWDIIRKYGKASEYKCADCDKPAEDWAWQHDTDDTCIDNYYPLCTKHHMQYDRGGEKHPLAFLSAQQVENIRKEYATGSTSHRRLAAKYEVNYGTIGKILRYERWSA